MVIQNDIFFYICFMAKIYTLDQAIKIVFADREYYLKMNLNDRAKMRVYKQRFDDGKLNFETKVSLVEKYGGKVTVDVKVRF